MANTSIGLVGFGEAGYHLTRGLRRAGAPPLIAFDIRAHHPTAGERICGRAAETGTRLAESPRALADSAMVILSVVTAASAVEAATSLAAHLSPDHLYVDCNSVSPATKRQIAAGIAGGAGRFVEAAILAPVAGLDHRVPIVLNGPWATAFAERVVPYQMRLDIMDAPIGAAAAVKMCRSIVIKGMEALLLECAAAASVYGATDRVYESLRQTYPGLDWRKTADYMIGRVREHGERRAHEMEEVAATLRAAGIEPVMAEATARRQAWKSTSQGDRRLVGERPETNDALVQLLVDRRDAPDTPRPGEACGARTSHARPD